VFRRGRSSAQTTLLSPEAYGALGDFGINHLQGHDPDTATTTRLFYMPGIEAARSNPEALVREVCSAAQKSGSWALVGAVRLLMELAVPADVLSREPQYLAVLDEELLFLQAQRVGAGALRPFEADRWISTQGSLRTFIGYELAEVPPVGEEGPVRELQLGELWKVAQLGAHPDSNVIFIERRERALFCVLTEAPVSDIDLRRQRWDWFSGDTLVGVLRELGDRMVTPPYWADPALAPFFPWRPPKSDRA
jgi:hypothetical protein